MCSFDDAPCPFASWHELMWAGSHGVWSMLSLNTWMSRSSLVVTCVNVRSTISFLPAVSGTANQSSSFLQILLAVDENGSEVGRAWLKVSSSSLKSSTHVVSQPPGTGVVSTSSRYGL